MLSMLHFPLMLRVKCPVVDRIHPKCNKFAMGVEKKVTGVSKPNDGLAGGRRKPPSHFRLHKPE